MSQLVYACNTLEVESGVEIENILEYKNETAYHRFRWYATFENKTPAETFPKFPSIIHVMPYMEVNTWSLGLSCLSWSSYTRIWSLHSGAGYNRVAIVCVSLSIGLVTFLAFVPFVRCLLVFFETGKLTICQTWLAGSASPQMESVRSAELRGLLILEQTGHSSRVGIILSRNSSQFGRNDAFHLRTGWSGQSVLTNGKPLVKKSRISASLDSPSKQ